MRRREKIKILLFDTPESVSNILEILLGAVFLFKKEVHVLIGGGVKMASGPHLDLEK